MKSALILALAAALAGCMSRPALLVDVNGREFEFKKFDGGRVPRGLEVTHFDSRTIRVVGDIPIEVNGISLSAQGDDLTIGGRKFKADREARVVIESDGEVQVRLNPLVPASPPAAPAVR